MILKIKITKDVLKRSMWCGTKQSGYSAWSTNCAVSVAVRDVFPNAAVTQEYIRQSLETNDCDVIKLPQGVSDFINEFDDLVNTPERRLDLPPFDFEIDLPQEVIDAIDISDIERSETLELVHPRQDG